MDATESAKATSGRRGTIDRSRAPHLYQHELDAAAHLAALGEDVVFVPQPQTSRGADIEIGGELWEIKSPTSSNRNTIVTRLGRGAAQSSKLILSLNRTSIGVEEAASMAREVIRKYPRVIAIRIIGRDGPNGALDVTIAR